MSEIVGPEQIHEAVMSTFIALSEMDLEHKKGKLEFIRKGFPGVIKDAEELWTACIADGVPEFTVFSPPSEFVPHMAGQDPIAGSPITWAIESSPHNHKDLYSNIYQKYIYITEDEGDKEEHANFTVEEKRKIDFRDLFDLSFELVRDIARAPHVLEPSSPNPLASSL